MKGWLVQRRRLLVVGCALGAAALLAAALSGQSDAVGGKWVPMNEAVMAVLEEEEQSGAGFEGNAEEGVAGSAGASDDGSRLDGENGAGGHSGTADGGDDANEALSGTGNVAGDGGGGAKTNGAETNVAETKGNETNVAEAKGDETNVAEAKGDEINGAKDEPAGGADGKIDVNRASAEQLDGLKGIGPAKAQAIVADREKNGKFHSVDDLLRVKGIGEKLLSSMKESVVALP